MNLQILHGRRYLRLSDKNCIRLLPQGGARGDILDRKGKLIVGSRISYDVMVVSKDAVNFDATLLKVASITGIKTSDLIRTFKSNFVSSFSPTLLAGNIGVEKAIALGELKNSFPELLVYPNPVRYYPNGNLASHVTGYLSEIDRWRLTKLEDYGYNTKDIVGFGGVEERYDYYLRQEEGGISFEVDHKGKFMRMLGFKSPRNGRNVQLTIDSEIQKIVEDKLGNRKGCVIIMDPYSGEIVAMSSSPNFNPSYFIKKENSYLRNVFNDSDAPMINRAISGQYPAASIFKIIVAAVALETSKINSGTSFVCTGKTRIGNREFKCWNTHGNQDVISGLANSCDVFFYRTGLLTGAQAIHDYAVKLGLSKPTGIDLPYEEAGFVPDPIWKKISQLKSWFDGDTANLAIGQGDLMTTPIQMTKVMCFFANKGYLVNPYVVKSVDGIDISATHKKNIKIQLKKSTMDIINKGLREVVTLPSGTGNVLDSLTLPVSGKTGTAQVSGKQPHGWFVGYFPSNKPRLVICVFLENGSAGYYSCLVAKQIIQEMSEKGLI
jgi:penicillin-binding protein 2